MAILLASPPRSADKAFLKERSIADTAQKIQGEYGLEGWVGVQHPLLTGWQASTFEHRGECQGTAEISLPHLPWIEAVHLPPQGTRCDFAPFSQKKGRCIEGNHKYHNSKKQSKVMKVFMNFFTSFKKRFDMCVWIFDTFESKGYGVCH